MNSNKSESEFYLVDASGFIFRAFHALPPLLSPHGLPIGAVYGFISMLLRLLAEHKPQNLGIIFDVGRVTFRQAIYPSYKMNRSEPPEDLIPQFSLVREACTAFGLPVLESPGFEADDLLASYTVEATRAGFPVTLVSSDKDLMQLVSDTVRLWDPLKNKAMGILEVIGKFGVPPDQVVQVQALMGDASDNIPGIPGIGPKTAAALIQEFQDLDTLYLHLDQIPQARRRDLLQTYKDQALISRRLVELAQNVPLPVPIADLAFQGIPLAAAQDFLETHGLKTLLPRLLKQKTPLSESPGPSPEPLAVSVTFREIQKINELEDLARRIQQTGRVALTLEGERTLALSVSGDQTSILSLGEATLLTQDVLTLPQAIPILKTLLEDHSITKIAYDIKPMLHHLTAWGIDTKSFEDLLVMADILEGNEAARDLPQLVQTHLNQTLTPLPRKSTKDPETLVNSFQTLAERTRILIPLGEALQKGLTEAGTLPLYETFERPLIPVLVTLENTGIEVDAAALADLSHVFEVQMTQLSDMIYRHVGMSFNLASPKQLGEILFETLKLSGGKKSQTGAYGTASDVLESLAAQGHEVAKWILSWRTFAKLKGTYTDALPKSINPQTGRIHTSFVMAGTSTGRLASSNPNLQNIPIRTEEGRGIRRAFVARPGCVLASFDYSQIELRLLAHLGQVTPLIEAFQGGIDIHTQTASQVFRVPLNQVDRDLRRKAKMINFGIIYGISPFGLASRLGISSKEAGQAIEEYLAHYHGIVRYMEETKAFARTHGYVETLAGRRCFIPKIHDKNHALRMGAERQAINAPLQGTAAELIKKAMINIHAFLKEQACATRLVLQIHDELLFEGPAQEIMSLTPDLKNLMTTPLTLSVPLVVDTGTGRTWEEAHG